MIGLGYLIAGVDGQPPPYGEATAVSRDGSVVVGWTQTQISDDVEIAEAFRWSAEGGLLGLGFSDPSGTSMSIARAVNGDGSIVLGMSDGRASIWDEAHGMRDLADVLVSEFGLDLGGWQLYNAVGISDDGLTIAGNGTNPQGEDEGWVVHLVPEPTPALLLGVAAAALAALRTRHRFL
jgi:uncharacterized membrane protein